MKTKRVISILMLLCFFIIWPSNARADMSDINEHEQRVIDAAIEGYVLDGKKYVATESGIAALQRKMRTVDLDARDADNLIESQLTEQDLDEQLEKGYIKLVSDDSTTGTTATPQGTTATPQGTTAAAQTPTANSQTTTATSQNSTTTPYSTTGSTSGSQGTTSRENNNNINTNQQVNQQNNQSSNKNSNMTVLDSDSSNIGGQNANVSQGSQAKAFSIWNAVVSDANAQKQESSGDSSTDNKGDSSQANSGNSSNQSSADSKTSLVEETLSAIESENKEKGEFSSYKMRSEEDADIKIVCEIGSDEVKIVDKNGNTVLSYTDPDVTSEGIEGNVVHVEWLIPISLILLFISIVFIYVEFRQGCYSKMQSGVTPSQKVRSILSIMMRIILIVCILLVFVASGLFSSLFRSSSVTQALNNSSYYEYAYTEMAKNTVRILEENDIDSLALVDVLNYDDFVLVIKQQIQKQLSTLDEELSIEKTQDNVNAKIDQYYEDAEEKQLQESGTEETKDEKKARKVARKEKTNVITNSVMTNYKKYADFYPAHFIRQVKRDLRATFQIVLPIAGLTILINIFALYHLYRRRYKGIGYIGGSIAVAAFGSLIASGVIYKIKPYTNFYLSPEYLYQFVLRYLSQGVQTYLTISVFLLILAIVVLGLNRIIFPKKRRI